MVGLKQDVMYINAAKQGEVPIDASWGLKFVFMDELTEEDKRVTSAVTEEGMALFYLGPRYQRVPLKDLTPEYIDDDLINALMFQVSDDWDPTDRGLGASATRTGRAFRRGNGEDPKDSWP